MMHINRPVAKYFCIAINNKEKNEQVPDPDTRSYGGSIVRLSENLIHQVACHQNILNADGILAANMQPLFFYLVSTILKISSENEYGLNNSLSGLNHRVQRFET